MTRLHKQVLGLSWLIIATELITLGYFHQIVFEWLSQNLWVVALPFAKAIVKKMVTLNIIALLKSLSVLVWHLSKLLLLKLLKTIGVRYGLFFSQKRWYWIRRSKVMFIRRGKQFFRSLGRFWSTYQRHQKILIIVAFFPIVIILSLLGLSFNVTRKTMVQKAQEGALFRVASTASKTNLGIRAWLVRIDRLVLNKIQGLTVEAKPLSKNNPKLDA
jgi:hypothetical protein